jgi:hypothetical protein
MSTVIPTQTTLTLSKTQAMVNESFDITVAVTWQGHPIAGAEVDIYFGGSKTITFTTGSDGTITATTSLPIAGTYDWQAKFAGGTYGSMTFGPSESSVVSIVILAAKIATTLTIAAYAPGTNTPITSGSVPLTVELRGLLKDANGNALNGKPIDIYQNGVKIGTATTAQVGAYAYQVTLSQPGTYAFYAYFAGDSTYEGC